MSDTIVLPSIDSEFGFNHGEMKEEVRDQLRDTKIDTRITRWLNMTIARLAGTILFPELISTSYFNTINGTKNYTLQSDFHMPKIFWIPDLLQALHPIEVSEIFDLYPDWSTVTGRPVRYMKVGPNSVDLFRIPDAAYTVNYMYYRRPLKLVNDTDVTDLPYQFHNVIIQGAIVRGMKYENNPQLADAIVEYREILTEVRKALYRRPDYRRVMSGPEIRGRQSLPILPPDHFPRG